MNNDTIASISTPPGEGGIGIIRISGDKAIDIASQIYTDRQGRHILREYKSHTIHYGFIKDRQDNIIDEVMISVMKAPGTYTREDIVEINCHGGMWVCKKILELTIDTGARIADPGEFTKRAFLNGRIDLTQAEAVMDTIRSSSDAALEESVKQLQGRLYEKLNNICSDILYEIAHIEAALDDPDAISLESYDEALLNKTELILSELDSLIKSYDEGRIIANGINTVILGDPNVGKSSLLNYLLNEDRAIVTDIPGTTRDALTETLRLGDVTLNITDTAGIRSTPDVIESIGIDKAVKSGEEADLIIYLLDINTEPDISDQRILNILRSKPVIFLLNKSDLNNEPADKDKYDNSTASNECNTDKAKSKDDYGSDINSTSGSHDDKDIYINKTRAYLDEKGIHPKDIIRASMKTGEGTEELTSAIHDLFYSEELMRNDQIMITSLRHVSLLKDSVRSLMRVRESIETGASEDLYCIDLTDAYRALAQITGAEVTESIVDEIFSKFCMGK